MPLLIWIGQLGAGLKTECRASEGRLYASAAERQNSDPPIP